MHTDAQQTAELHALPAFAAWARARGLRMWDRVLLLDGREYVITLIVAATPTINKTHEICTLSGGFDQWIDPADCRLMPSESDLMDYAETLGRVDTSGPWTDEQYKGVEYQAELYLREGPIGGRHVSESATTRIGALVAAVKAVEGGE